MSNQQPPMSASESKNLRGSVKITYGRGDEILSVYEAKNFVVKLAASAVRDFLTNAWAGGPTPYLGRMIIGQGGYLGGSRRTPDSSWHILTDVFDPLYSKDFTSATTSSDTGDVATITCTCKFEYGEAGIVGLSTDVNEVGLILYDPGSPTGIITGAIAGDDKLFAYRTFTERPWDTAGTYIDVVWTIYIDRT